MIIGVHCVTRHHDPRRMWPQTSWIALLQMLIYRYHCAIMFIGAFQPEDVAYVQEIISQLDPDHILFDPRPTTLNDDALWMQKMDLFVCLNSAPMAIATAIGIPVFGIIGYSPAKVALPVRDNVDWIEDPGLKDYDPEHPYSYIARMEEITPEAVFDKIVKMLSR